MVVLRRLIAQKINDAILGKILVKINFCFIFLAKSCLNHWMISLIELATSKSIPPRSERCVCTLVAALNHEYSGALCSNCSLFEYVVIGFN